MSPMSFIPTKLILTQCTMPLITSQSQVYSNKNPEQLPGINLWPSMKHLYKQLQSCQYNPCKIQINLSKKINKKSFDLNFIKDCLHYIGHFFKLTNWPLYNSFKFKSCVVTVIAQEHGSKTNVFQNEIIKKHAEFKIKT